MTDKSAQQVTDVSRITPPAGTFRALLSSEENKRRFRDILGELSGAFIASVAAYFYQSPELHQCDPNSVISAAINAASLRLFVDKTLGYACIVPFNNKKTGKKEAQFQVMWKGYVQLAQRTGQYAAVNAQPVYEGEIRSFNRFTGTPVFGERIGDKVTGYLAYFRLINGFEKYIYKTHDEVMAHGKRYSKQFNNEWGHWKTNPEAMGCKTVVKELIGKWGPTSSEIQKAMQAEVPPDEREELPAIDAPAPTNGHIAEAQPDNSELDAVVIEHDKAAELSKKRIEMFGPEEPPDNLATPAAHQGNWAGDKKPVSPASTNPRR